MRFMLAQSPAQVPVKYVSVQCKGGLLSVLYGTSNMLHYMTISELLIHAKGM